jgi:hypothetical protein
VGSLIHGFIGNVIVLAGLGLALCALGVLVYQWGLWLHDGYWTDLQFRLAWEFPRA